MSITIRGERPGDEPALELLLTRAFRSGSVAGLLTVLRRHWPGYDRGWSLVAWDGERAVGHVLGLTARLRLLSTTRPAMSIGPVCVHPDYQRQGLGRRLLGALHELGRGAGAEFVVLEGVPSYYPQLGYRPSWSFPALTIDHAALPPAEVELQATPVQPADLPWLAERLAVELAEVDLGWVWPQTLDCWTLPGLNAVLWRTSTGRPAAYTLARPCLPWERPAEALLLADDPASALAALRELRPASLAHHPAGWLCRRVLQAPWAMHGERRVASPCMTFELVPGALADYYAAVDEGAREPGLVNWPLPFLLC